MPWGPQSLRAGKRIGTMLDPGSYRSLREVITDRIGQDLGVLTTLRNDVVPLRSQTRRVSRRSSTSVALVGTDGGNNRVRFDPFFVQLVRVVDSSNNEYILEAITPETGVGGLSESQFDADGSPRTALGKMMAYLQVTNLTQLSHMIRRKDDGRPASPSWVQVYRELVEWAVLFSILQERDFATDTMIVFDGLLRSKVFAGTLFRDLGRGFQQAIDRHYQESHRRVYLVGLAKHSKVLDTYQLAMRLEDVLTNEYPAYVEVPRRLEETAYVWSEYARGDDREIEGGEVNKFVNGKMFFVKFGPRSRDPIWPVDVFLPQVHDAHKVLGCLLADAVEGFPVPFYPRCLQTAHENAALVDFDFDVLQGEIINGIRTALGGDGDVIDEIRLSGGDPAQRRY